MKKFIKNNVFGFLIGIILCSGIVYAATLYKATDVSYEPSDASWEVSNVSDAINSLYSMKNELDNIKGIGDAEASSILSGKTALVQGSLVTGTMTDKGAWTNTPTSSGKVTIPAGYHNGSGYVDTSSVYNSGFLAGQNNSGQVDVLVNSASTTSWSGSGYSKYILFASGISENVDHITISTTNGTVRSISRHLTTNGTLRWFDSSHIIDTNGGSTTISWTSGNDAGNMVEVLLGVK